MGELITGILVVLIAAIVFFAVRSIVRKAMNRDCSCGCGCAGCSGCGAAKSERPAAKSHRS